MIVAKNKEDSIEVIIADKVSHLTVVRAETGNKIIIFVDDRVFTIDGVDGFLSVNEVVVEGGAISEI